MTTGFHVSYGQTVVPETGDRVLQCADNILQFVYGFSKDSLQAMKFRAAPSLLARSEAELLGVSIPRFVYRTIRQDKDWGFLSIRRIALLSKVVGPFGRRTANADTALEVIEENSRQDPSGRILRSTYALAESILVPPKSMESEGYKVLCSNVSELFDEPDLVGTPFLNHIRLGGGMCAQAVCLMASILMHEYVSTVVGIADITAISNGTPLGQASELDLGGLSSRKMATYFRQVGAASNVERPNIRSRDIVQMEAFYGAIHSYIQSGYPVALRCGLREFANEVLWAGEAANYMRKPVPNHNMTSEEHVILLVGSRLFAGKHEFLCNDPASFPFIKADASQLDKARPVVQSDSAAVNSKAIRICVTIRPREAKLHLLSEKDSVGLFELSNAVQADAFQLKLPLLSGGAIGRGTIRLLSAEALLSFQRPSQLATDGEHTISENDWASIRSWAIKLHTVPAFVWLQMKSHGSKSDFVASVWVWDATKSPPEFVRDALSVRDEYLIGCLGKSGKGYEPTWANFNYTNGGMLKKPKLSLITSFTTHGAAISLNLWPPDAAAAEYYTLMQPDIARRGNGRSAESAVLYLSSLMSDANAFDEEVASTTHWGSRLMKNHQGEFIGFASFIPEITSSSREVQDRVRSAISVITRLSESVPFGSPTKPLFIELVCGTLVDSIWSGISSRDSKEKICASLMAREEAINRFLAILEDVVSDVRPKKTIFALELEPGPYFVLNDWKSLSSIADRISSSKVLRKHVGFNLDCAHFRIADDVTPDAVWAKKEIRERIAHAHLSGHFKKGHLGDSQFRATGTDFAESADWMAIILGVMNQQSEAVVPFSGHVSIEYEGAPSVEGVSKSLLSAKLLIDSVGDSGSLRRMYGGL